MQLLHVTTSSCAQRIRTCGFEPRIGPRSTACGEQTPATYFFADEEALNSALSNWLGEAFEDCAEDLVVIVADVPQHLAHIDSIGFEIRTTTPLPTSTIITTYIVD